MRPSNSPVSDASGNSNGRQPANLSLSAIESSIIARVESDLSEEDSRKPVSEATKKEEAENGTSSLPDVLGKQPTEVMFFKCLHNELRKAIHFFDRTCEEYQIRANRLREGTKILKMSGYALVGDKWLVMARAAFKVYRDLVLLETYAIMTYCGFSKILKKHDKLTGRNTRAAFMRSMVSKANFSDTAQLQGMIQMSQLKYKEASIELEKAGRTNLQEDERLFINLIAQINEDVLEMADEEGTPVSTGRETLSVDFFKVKQGSLLDQTAMKKYDQENEPERKRSKFS